MDLARLLFSAGQSARTTVCLVTVGQGVDNQPDPARIELFRGWVHAVDAAPLRTRLANQTVPPRGEDALTALLKLAGAIGRFDDQLERTKRGACTPFHPAALVRNAVDAHTKDATWTGFRGRLGLGTVQLAEKPHPSCLGSDEKPLVAFVARPRTVDEIDAAKLCSPLRAARLFAFLEAVGVLAVLPRVSSAFAVLGLPDGAALDEVRRAFKKLARELHPDRHPRASDDERRDLQRRFAEVSAAYRQLV